MVEGVPIQPREVVDASSVEKLSSVILTVGHAKEQGHVRGHQEDAYFVPRFPQKDPYFLVADGAGGHARGDIAAQLAVESFAQVEKQIPSYQTNRQLLESLFKQANSAIYHERARRRNNMLTTGAALALEEENDNLVATIANAGDSRVYLFERRRRKNPLRQLTTDHTWVQEQVAKGMLTEEQARRNQYKNIITRALGNEQSVQVDITQVTVQVGDVFLLCTDGLSGYVPEKYIQSILKKVADGNLSPQRASEQLTQEANRLGGYDNSTAVVVRLAKKTPSSKHRRLQKIIDVFKRTSAQPESMERVAAPKPPRPIEPTQSHTPDPRRTSPKQPQVEAFQYGNLTIDQMYQQKLFSLATINNTSISPTGRVVVDLSRHYNGTVQVEVPLPVLKAAYQNWRATKEGSGTNIVSIPVFYGGKWYGGGIHKNTIEQILKIPSENR